MKRFVFLIVLAAVTLAAMADGWRYNDSPGIASGVEYVTGDINQKTCLVLRVGEIDGRDWVVGILVGECDMYDFQDGQHYVMVNLGDGREKWDIVPTEYKGRKYQAFIFVDSVAMIERLKKCDYFDITLPLYRVGTHTFYFNADGYPLDY